MLRFLSRAFADHSVSRQECVRPYVCVRSQIVHQANAGTVAAEAVAVVRLHPKRETGKTEE